MTIEVHENNYLTIQLLSYDKPNGLAERYYFLEMSTLQATTLLHNDRKIISSKIVAYTHDNKYLDEQTVKDFKTIGDFNNFFIKSPDYYIHNCKIELERWTILNSHDDGEVSIQFFDNVDQNFINDIFDRHNLDKALIERIKNNPGHYITIDRQSKVTGSFDTFDNYVKNSV